MKEKIEVKNLDHLGIIAGIVDEIGLESIVNESIGIDKREKISAGKIVKAIILNSYLAPKKIDGNTKRLKLLYSKDLRD